MTTRRGATLIATTTSTVAFATTIITIRGSTLIATIAKTDSLATTTITRGATIVVVASTSST
jgi:hypothetical protein